MKKLILGTILILLSQTIFGMEEIDKINILSELAKHHPELPMKIIEQGIKFELRSDADPAKAVIKAFRYINTVMMIDKSWYSQKAELIARLKDLAKKELAPEYEDLSKEELNDKLNKAIVNLVKSALKYGLLNLRTEVAENKNTERNEIIKLILSGADSNFFKEMDKNGIKYELLMRTMITLEDDNSVLLLILYGADVNRKDSFPGRLLDHAISSNHGHKNIEKVKKIIELLIAHGANVNERDPKIYGYNIAIRRATIDAGEGKDILLETLLKNGAELNDLDLYKIYFLILDQREVYEKFAEILKKYGYQI
jgi:hypothetical protein